MGRWCVLLTSGSACYEDVFAVESKQLRCWYCWCWVHGLDAGIVGGCAEQCVYKARRVTQWVTVG